MKKLGFAIVALALCIGRAAGPAAAQEEAPVPDESPELRGAYFDTTQVNVVNVEVFVTDKKGNRVTDLGREDFEVLENGEPMEITNFFAVAGGRPLAAGPPTAPGAAPLTPPAAVPALPEDQRLHLIVYVDNYNIRPANRNRTLSRLRRFLQQRLGRDDRVMVVSYDQSLHLRQPFTSDRHRISAALEELEKLSGSAVNRDSARRIALETIEDAEDQYLAMSTARSYAEQVYAETDFTLDALAEQVNALSGLVGRKALLYISDGIPLLAGEDVFIAVDERFSRVHARMEAANYSYANRYREIVAGANAGGTTFYTLDAGGLKSHASISAEYGGTTQGGGQAFIDTVRSGNLQAPLHILADDTGGRAIVNTNAIEAGLGRIAEDFENYYSLGYSPPHNASGRYYKIEVKTKRKGLTVRHRNGYRDMTPEARMTSGAIAALHFGFEVNPLGADLELGPARPNEDGKFLLPMTIRFPLGELALAPRKGFHIGRVKVSVVTMDEQGRLSEVNQQEPLTITIPEDEIEQARSQYFSYDLDLLVRRGFLQIAVGLRDEIGSETTFLRRTAQVAAR